MMDEGVLSFETSSNGFLLASAAESTPIYYSADSAPAVVIAVNTFADDVERVTGVRPPVKSTEKANVGKGIYVGAINSSLVKDAHATFASGTASDVRARLEGKWECWDVSAAEDKVVISGSCRVSREPEPD